MTAALIALLAQSPTVDLAAVGDVMLGRHVGRRIAREGFGAIFSASAPELRKADLTFGNLECVLSRRPFEASKRVLLAGDPKSAKGLSGAGFDVMSVANNHAVDAGREGLSDTVTALSLVGIRAIGQDRRAVTLEVRALRIAFLAYCDFPDQSGIASTNEAQLPRDIAEARRAADVVVVSWHWGDELSSRVSPRQRRLAALAAASGADLILGHHPHVLQESALLTGKDGRKCLVAYSLGNFIFDAGPERERKTGVLRVRLTREGVQSFRWVPYQIVKGAPQPVGRGSIQGAGSAEDPVHRFVHG